MRFFRPFAVVMSVALLGACTNDLERLKTAAPGGDVSAFNKSLGSKYQALADFEANRMVDWADAEHYATKALAAWNGEDVQPDDPEIRSLPANLMADAKQDRLILLGLLDQGNWRSKRPSLSAEAQTKYDCWLEQLEEGWQTEDIAACRQDFLDAVAQLLAERASPPMAAEPAPAPAPAPAPQPAAPEPAEFVVYFEYDTTSLVPASHQVVQAAAEEAKKRDVNAMARETGEAPIEVVGHADRSGNAEYNLALSIRRANAVRGLLYELGVPTGTVTIDAYGEQRPAVETGDGVKALANRRVVITIK